MRAVWRGGISELEQPWATGLLMGMNTLACDPTVTGDCITHGEEPWPVGDENAGVADRDPRETENKTNSKSRKTPFYDAS